MKLSNGVVVIELRDVFRLVPSGYYIDSDGAIWSTRENFDSKPVMLEGTEYSTGRYFKLGGYYFRHDDLLERAKVSPQWEQTFSTPLRDAQTENESDQSSKCNVKSIKGGYVIATLREGVLSLDDNPTVYLTDDEVEAEMACLARLYPRVTFVALKVVRSVTASELVWE